MVLRTWGPRDETQKPGLSWYWITTEGLDVSLVPIRRDEPLEHLATGDNNFINYASYIVLQWKDPAQLVANMSAASSSRNG